MEDEITDKIIIKELKIFAYHGVNPEEKENGQNFLIDAELQVDLSKPCISDNIDDTVSYSKVIKTIRKAMLDKKYDLIECAAEHIIEAIFAEYRPVSNIKLTLKKPEAPISADFGYVGVEISRGRKSN